ncbi:uncharacterized protein [Ambystoma mexicanum]|uniref:uncharacterized protein isoform X2 n=1 Tax=Ambystoma mexicanum TaxID=8296 RepID=UPI0037E93C48
MSCVNPEICENCREEMIAGSIRHKLYCYDVYIPSANIPQRKKDAYIDNLISEKIVAPLEEKKYLCYHGSRDNIGGEHYLDTINKAVHTVPVTLVPIYNKSQLSPLVPFILKPHLRDRLVLLVFDYPRRGICESYFSVDMTKPEFLRTLILTIDSVRNEHPLEKRKIQLLAMSETGSANSTSTASSTFEKYSAFSRFDPLRKSLVKTRLTNNFSGTESLTLQEIPGPFSRSDPLRRSSRIHRRNWILQGTELTYSLENEEIEADHHICDVEFLYDLLRNCISSKRMVRNHAIRTMTKWILINIMTFYKQPQLQKMEQMVRGHIESGHSLDEETRSRQEQLHFWTLAGIFINVYKDMNMTLKSELKSITFKKHIFKQDTKSYYEICLHTFQSLSMSLCKKIQTQSHRTVYSNKVILTKLEGCLDIVNENISLTSKKSDQFRSMMRHLRRLPWDVRHVFVVIITEKLFQNAELASSESFLYDVCTISQKKHCGIFLEVTEHATEHIVENHTKGAVDVCLQLLLKLWKWCGQKRQRGKPHHFKIILKHYFKKLVYHPLSHVRNSIVPLLFSEGETITVTALLGSQCIIANQKLVEDCIHQYFLTNHSGMTVKSKREEGPVYFMKFDASTLEGDALIYLSIQQTLNDILETNSTDDFHGRFQEMGTIVMECQNSDYVARLHTMQLGNAPHYFVIENGKPLLKYLHESENKLPLSNVIDILEDISKAVQHCHQHDVVLRDITPASFIVLPTHGNRPLPVQTKLLGFQYAKKMQMKDVSSQKNPSDVYENNDSAFIQGEQGEPLPVFFSAPESLHFQIFCKHTDAWMVAATFYSVLLYGRNPYIELAHLPLSSLIAEIVKGHSARSPYPIPSVLWKIIATSLSLIPEMRMNMDTILEELESCKSALGDRINKVYVVQSRFSPISAEDIDMGFFNEKGTFQRSKIQDVHMKSFQDKTTHKGCVHEAVSLRMNVRTRLSLQSLNHENLVKVATITKSSLATQLVYNLHSEYILCLVEASTLGHVDLKRLLSYLAQTVSALQYLHSKNILHCDLRCRAIYVSYSEEKIKVGRFGRAVCLENDAVDQSVYKLMPADATPWSAPEVIANGMYSKASDIYSVAALFCEALNSHETFLSMGFEKLLNLFHVLQNKMVMKEIKKRECPEDLINVSKTYAETMKACWEPNPTRRPSLETISEAIERMSHEWNLFKNVRVVSINSSTDEENSVYEAYGSTDGQHYGNITPLSMLSSSEDALYDEVTLEINGGVEEDEITSLNPEGIPPLMLPTRGMVCSQEEMSTAAMGESSCLRVIAPAGDPIYDVDHGFDRNESWGVVVYEFESQNNIPKHIHRFIECRESSYYDDAGIRPRRKRNMNIKKLL